MTTNPPHCDYQTLKDKGNEKFKAKDYEGALEYYTKAIEIKSNEPIAYSNRAACHINLEQYFDALNDCNKAIELDSNLLKAYYRRAMVLRGLSRFHLALADFKKVLESEPNNKQVKDQIETIESNLRADSRLDMEVIQKPEGFRSRKPLQTFELNNQYTGAKSYILNE